MTGTMPLGSFDPIKEGKKKSYKTTLKKMRCASTREVLPSYHRSLRDEWLTKKVLLRQGTWKDEKSGDELSGMENRGKTY